MKRILRVSAICGAFLMMTNLAFATPITTTNVVTPDGTLAVNELDWLPGSGLSVNGNPIGPGGSVNPVKLLYQASLGSFITAAAPNLNSTYEFTVTGSIFENATFLLGGQVALFSLAPDPTNAINIYYDTNTSTFKNIAAGTGFNNGTLVLTAIPYSLTGNFSQTDTNGNGFFDNQDTGVGGSDIQSLITYVNNSIFPDLSAGGAWITHFIGTQNTPPEGVNTVLMFDGTVPDYYTGGGGTTPTNTNDILLKVDGNSHFTPNVVPEPSTILLLGIGLLGVAGYTRKRIHK